ncbi:hypothetical protein SAMN03080598_01800 [Algoriphagus boritolerans DSM 17298 = JCM 18970]|uniref:Uncharacterized protein n=1 Tax=Algoriphagus boritolerans DSM 17298 = JCM 18970 TaxID=1120964 RepID=A0A1H5VQH0_9BACT|nr:hypothetical protein SAMN03080598_01800 [Algoriphagus boritolerans DSM 17298 = JCM 18970]
MPFSGLIGRKTEDGIPKKTKYQNIELISWIFKMLSDFGKSNSFELNVILFSNAFNGFVIMAVNGFNWWEIFGLDVYF